MVWFFPDFLIWTADTVICVDAKGQHIVEGDARRKLLAFKPHKKVPTTVEVKFVSEGKRKPDGTSDGKDGFSIWGLGSGRELRALPHDDLESLLRAFNPRLHAEVD